MDAQRKRFSFLKFVTLITVSCLIGNAFGSEFKSINILSLSPAFAQTSGLGKPQADVLLQQGIRQYKIGEFAAAINSLQQALTIYQSLGDRTGIANTFAGLGDTYFSLGEYALSLPYYQESLRLMQELGNLREVEEILLSLSNVYFYLGEEDEVKAVQQQAEEIRRELGNPTRETAFLGNIGLREESVSQHLQAIKFYQQQLQNARDVGNITLEIDALTNLARAYESAGDDAQAIAFRQALLNLAEEINAIPVQAVSLNQLGSIYESVGEVRQAIPFYQQQLQLARETGDRALETATIDKLALAYEASEQYPLALELRQQQLAEAKEKGDRILQGKALNDLGQVFLKSNQLADAQKSLLEAQAIWETLRTEGQRNLDRQPTTYRLLQQVLVAQNQPEAALEIAQQQQTRKIVDVLGMRLATDAVGTGLKAASPILAFPTIKSIQQAAKTHGTLVVYSVISDRELYAWVIAPDGKITFRPIDIPAESRVYPVSVLTELVAQSLTAIGAKTAQPASLLDPNPLLQLHQILIQPIADLLPQETGDRVVFVPQDTLLLTPFAALSSLSGEYLIQKYTLVTVPAIPVLDLAKQQRAKVRGSQALVMGNPIAPRISSSQSLAPLTGAEREALEVAQFLKTEAITGESATIATFLERLPKARTIHLATYGLLDNLTSSGVPGAIALSPSANDSGLLTASDILNLAAQPKGSPLRAEVVVLSAGRGKVSGDGLIGLSLALISAGVPSTILSLGSDSNPITAYQMGEFYKQLQQTRDPAKALRQSAIATLKQYPNSRNWAAYTLVGY